MRATACLIVTGLASLALLPAARPGPDAAGRAAALAPLLEDDAYAVARLDATKHDADATARLITSFLPGRKDQMEAVAAIVKKSHAAFTAAGGTEAAVVFSTPELPGPSYVVVPLKGGADEAALTRLLRDASGGGWRVVKKGNALVAGVPEALARLDRGKPAAPRPELAEALAAAGDGGAQVLLLPTDDQRRVVEELVGMTRPFGDVSGRALTRGVRWAALGLDPGPEPTLRLTVGSADAAAAEGAAGLIREGLAALGRQKFFGEEKPLREVLPAEYKSAVAALTPKAEGARVIVTAPAGALKGFGSALLDRLGGEGLSEAGAEMKRILIALHNYASAHNHTFPPTAIRPKDGKPLLSWRVAVLPYLGEDGLYREFRLDEPWDSEHNKKLIGRMPKVFRSPRTQAREPGLTTFLAPVGKDVAFTGEATGRPYKEFADGTSNTILLVDVADDRAVVWTKPDDLAVDLNAPKKGLLGHYPGFFLVGMADGSVRRVSQKVSDRTLRSAFTCAGAEVLGPDW